MSNKHLSVLHQALLDRVDGFADQRIQQVTRATDTLPDGAQESLFDVNASVVIYGILGEVTTGTDGTAVNLKLEYEADTLGATTDWCVYTSIATKAQGTGIFITGTDADALQFNLSQAGKLISNPIIMANDGFIALQTNTTPGAGSIAWTLFYGILDSTGLVAATAV